MADSPLTDRSFHEYPRLGSPREIDSRLCDPLGVHGRRHCGCREAGRLRDGPGIDLRRGPATTRRIPCRQGTRRTRGGDPRRAGGRQLRGRPVGRPPSSGRRLGPRLLPAVCPEFPQRARLARRERPGPEGSSAGGRGPLRPRGFRPPRELAGPAGRNPPRGGRQCQRHRRGPGVGQGPLPPAAAPAAVGPLCLLRRRGKRDARLAALGRPPHAPAPARR